MKAVARMELVPGMTLGEDVISQGNVLFSAGTVLTQNHIDRLKRYSIMIVTVMEDIDFATTHYEKLRFSDEFKVFEQKHEENQIKYKKLVVNLAAMGMAIPEPALLEIYNDMRGTYPHGAVLLDYLYNLMPNEDELTFNHCLNSALLAGAIAEWISMPQDDKKDLILAGFYYDIGKLRIPYDLLWRPGKLTQEEFNMVKMHPVIGFNMLKSTGVSQKILDAVLMHHERMDGSGYPNGTQGSEINTLARYIAVVDTYIAMASPRPHRNALTPLQIIGHLETDMSKYDAELLVPLMKRIANAQTGTSIQLSDESVWEVFIIHSDRFSRPILKNENQEILDLKEHPELEIVKMM